MANNLLLKIKGLYSFPNHLSGAPQGALLTANNIVINRDEVAESRRGFNLYGSAMGSSTSITAHQLFTYKGRLLRHFGAAAGTTIEYDSDGAGTFSQFQLTLAGNTHTSTALNGLPSTSQLEAGMFVSGSGIPLNTTITTIVSNTAITLSNAATTSLTAASFVFTYNIAEVSQGLRIKNIEQNGNLYFTSSHGIKKISSANAAGLSTSLISSSGGAKALDFKLTTAAGPGFLTSSHNVTVTGETNNGTMSGSITEITVTSPTVITSLNHKLFSGNIITITNSTCVPSINGLYPVTVLDKNTFSIPVNVTSNANLSGTITANTVANPTVVTSAAHGLVTGGSITITGSNSTPVINGTYNVTVTGVNTFTVPVNVTIAGTAGSWTASGNTANWTYTGNANIIYNITDTSVLTTGYYIIGTGVPSSTTIVSVLDANTIQISANATASGTVSLSSATNSVVGYRVLWGIQDANQNVILGSVSSRGIVRNTDPSNSKNVSLEITIPKGITTAHFYQIYRTPVFDDPFSVQDPGDEEQLVIEGNPLQADLTNGYITVLDRTPNSFQSGGANLYTNQNSGEGILQNNDLPPLAQDITSFKGYTFYSNTQTLQRLNLSLLSVTQFVADTSTFTISDGTTSNTYTFSAAENITAKKIIISAAATPAQEVDETARSMVRVINRQASEIVYAYYLSGPTDVPGLILLEARGLNQAPFTVVCNDAATTGVEFNPKLPSSGSTVISDNEVQPNRVYYSKFQQPEAVPIVNYIDVGPKDKQIIRIVALRDNLFIFKQDGVYRLSGQTSAQFTVYPFDFSVIIKAPDSATVLNNQVYLYSSQGVTVVTDTGAQVISRPIEDKISKLLIPSYTNFSTNTFGVSYESDRTYYLFTVSAVTDTFPTVCHRYNTFTQSWTESDLAKRCGVVNASNDLLYLGATDTNYIEQERKMFDRTDFADREFTIALSSGAVSSTTITLPSVSNIHVGDVLTQTQYLTINQFNQLLSKLDSDSVLSFRQYVATFTASPGVNLSTLLDSLIAEIAVDPGRVAFSGHTSGATYLALSPTPLTFAGQQSTFNSLITLLNNDPGVGYKNYKSSSGTTIYEFNILSVGTSTITSPYTYPLIVGNVVVYNHITTELQWVPQIFQDVSLTKHVSEGTLIFEDSSFSTATLSYSTDISSGFEDQDITGDGNGIYGNNVYGNGIYGGSGNSVPFRTYLPKEKQRCRYVNVKFTHAVARESYSLYGCSLVWAPISSRGWR